MELSGSGWIGCAACIVCVVCAALCAFFAGMACACTAGKGQGTKAPRPPKKARKLFPAKTDKQREEQARILQAEMVNFMNYNGDRQSDPKEVVSRGR